MEELKRDVQEAQESGTDKMEKFKKLSALKDKPRFSALKHFKENNIILSNWDFILDQEDWKIDGISMRSMPHDVVDDGNFFRNFRNFRMKLRLEWFLLISSNTSLLFPKLDFVQYLRVKYARNFLALYLLFFWYILDFGTFSDVTKILIKTVGILFG